MDDKRKAEIDEVWESYNRFKGNGKGDYYRNILIEHYLSLAKSSAKCVYRRIPWKVELDDLVSAGVFGLIDSIQTYNSLMGVRFEVYSFPRIRGAIIDEVRDLKWESVKKLNRQLQDSKPSFEEETYDCFLYEPPSLCACKKELKSFIQKGLSKEEQLFLALYYYESLTLKEIGAVLDLSESRVCQMKSEMIEKIRERAYSCDSLKTDLAEVVSESAR